MIRSNTRPQQQQRLKNTAETAEYFLTKQKKRKWTGAKCVPIFLFMYFSVVFPVSLLSRIASIKRRRSTLVAGKRYIPLWK
jgi:hypothetical protein